MVALPSFDVEHFGSASPAFFEQAPREVYLLHGLLPWTSLMASFAFGSWSIRRVPAASAPAPVFGSRVG